MKSLLDVDGDSNYEFVWVLEVQISEICAEYVEDSGQYHKSFILTGWREPHQCHPMLSFNMRRYRFELEYFCVIEH